MIEQVFGWLTALGDDPSNKPGGKRRVMVRCRCGAEKSVRLDGLRSGAIRSCGCKRSEHGLRHGFRRSGSQNPTYVSWYSMIQRCTNSATPAYRHYGGRGIRVCPQWSDFRTFLADMGERPSLGHQLDRKDNNGDYTPENCKWSTRSEQMLNTRRVVTVEWMGRTESLRSLALQHGMDPTLVLQRFSNGWAVDKALSTPNMRNKREPSHN